jgi:hypothetical protein
MIITAKAGVIAAMRAEIAGGKRLPEILSRLRAKERDKWSSEEQAQGQAALMSMAEEFVKKFIQPSFDCAEIRAACKAADASQNLSVARRPWERPGGKQAPVWEAGTTSSVPPPQGVATDEVSDTDSDEDEYQPRLAGGTDDNSGLLRVPRPVASDDCVFNYQVTWCHSNMAHSLPR